MMIFAPAGENKPIAKLDDLSPGNQIEIIVIKGGSREHRTYGSPTDLRSELIYTHTITCQEKVSVLEYASPGLKNGKSE